MRGNQSLSEKTGSPLKLWRRFPEPGLRPLRDCASSTGQSCGADRRAAWPVLRTIRVETLFLTRPHSKNTKLACLFPRKHNLAWEPVENDRFIPTAHRKYHGIKLILLGSVQRVKERAGVIGEMLVQKPGRSLAVPGGTK